MTNIYVTQELEGIGTKRKVNWVWLIMFKLKVFNGVLIFMATKKVPHTKFHLFKSIEFFCTFVIVSCMIRIRFENILRCIH
jgi:uncharacterized membrane protein